MSCEQRRFTGGGGGGGGGSRGGGGGGGGGGGSSGEGISQMEAFLASAKLTRRPGLAEAPGTWPHAVLRVENLATYSRSRCHRCCARLALRGGGRSRRCFSDAELLQLGLRNVECRAAGGCVATLQRPSRTAHREAGAQRLITYPGNYVIAPRYPVALVRRRGATTTFTKT